MKQSKRFYGDMKPEHKKTASRTTMSPTTGIDITTYDDDVSFNSKSYRDDEEVVYKIIYIRRLNYASNWLQARDFVNWSQKLLDHVGASNMNTKKVWEYLERIW